MRFLSALKFNKKSDIRHLFSLNPQKSESLTLKLTTVTNSGTSISMDISPKSYPYNHSMAMATHLK